MNLARNLSSQPLRVPMTLPKKIEGINEFESYLFEKSLSSSTVKRHLERAKRFWFELVTITSKSLLSIHDWKQISEKDLTLYEQQIRLNLKEEQIKKSTAYNLLYSIQLFLHFLANQDIVMFKYEIPKEFHTSSSPDVKRNRSIKLERLNKNSKTKKKNYPVFVYSFIDFLRKNNYASSTIFVHKYRLVSIIKSLATHCGFEITSEETLSRVNLELISRYEDYLFNRITLKEIKTTTAYDCMKTIRLFLQFLYQEQIIDFKYEIPKHFVVQPIRENSYVDQELLLKLINAVLSNPSKIRIRNLALLLIYTETGCRPVEAANIQLSDLSLSERTIKLFSIKSGSRKVSISKETIDVLKQYILLREELVPKSNYLFLNRYGETITASYLSLLLSAENKRVFGINKVTARALRHTYVTNAIDNHNDFKEVSDTMGHKHWVSTFYYLHRSKKRLLANTLPNNPLSFFTGLE